MADEQAWTIGRLLTWTTDYFRDQGSDSPRLEAEILLSEARGCQRIELYTAFEEEPSHEARTAFRELVRRRAEGMPVAYLVGRKEFYSMDFRVTPDVLIPRPETELLVLTLLDLVKARPDSAQPITLCDVGTGSGVLAVCIAKHLSNVQVTAIDTSPAALKIAQQNAEQHQVADRVALVQSDLLSALPAGTKFDYVVSNPPYISTPEMVALPDEIRDYEPHLALHGGERGTELIEQFLPQAADRLGDGGRLLIEISPMIADEVEQLVSATPGLTFEKTIRDLAGHSRIIQAVEES